MSEPWHGDSRFWRIVPYFIVLAALLAVYFDAPSVFTAPLTSFITVAGAQSVVRHHHEGRVMQPKEDLP